MKNFHLFLIINLLFIGCTEEKNISNSKLVKVNWNVGDTKRIQINNEIIQRWKNDSVSVAESSQTYCIKVISYIDESYELEIEFLSTPKPSLNDYILSAKDNLELRYYDWHQPLSSVCSPFTLSFNTQTGDIELLDWEQQKDKFLDSLMERAVFEDYTLGTWKNIKEHLEMNLDFEHNMRKQLIHQLTPIFDFYRFEAIVGGRIEFEKEISWFTGESSVPVNFLITKQENHPRFELKAIDVSNITETNQKRIESGMILNVTEIDTSSLTTFDYDEHSSWLTNITINIIDTGLIHGEMWYKNRAIIIQ